MWRICTAFPFNEPAGEFKADMFLMTAVFSVQKKGERQMRHFLFRDINRRQHRRCFFRITNVINGYNRGQIPSFSVFAQGVKNAERCAVVRAENSGRLLRGVQQGGHCAKAFFPALVGRIDAGIIEGKLVVDECLIVADIAGFVGAVSDIGDIPVPE